ncbi:MAG: ScpA family protein [Minisyncoccia bacterium]
MDINPVGKINYTIRTKAYEGPFELLLDLIEKRKLLVNEISLTEVTDDFIQHVRSQAAFPMEDATNFIAVAATLLLIKSKSLIPDLALTEEEEEGIADLEQRLALYEKARAAARELGRIFGQHTMFSAGEKEAEPFFAPSKDLNQTSLAEALANALTALEKIEELPEARVKSTVTIEEMMDRLAKRVSSALTLSFKDFAGDAKEKIEVIVSFLALLELVKQGAVETAQHNHFDDIKITHTASSNVPRYE